jgi:hypothetical protein
MSIKEDQISLSKLIFISFCFLNLETVHSSRVSNTHSSGLPEVGSPSILPLDLPSMLVLLNIASSSTVTMLSLEWNSEPGDTGRGITLSTSSFDQPMSTKLQKMELLKRREMHEERKEGDESMLRKLQKKKIELELELERERM